MSRLPRRPVLRAAVFAVVLPTPLLVAVELHDRPPPITILVSGSEAMVDRAATLGDVIQEFSLKARNGRLLDVEGSVLDRRVDPGEIHLNGDVAPRSTPLEAGDVIEVVPGTDRTERTRREVEHIAGRQLQNPMFTLETSRMQEITTIGRTSGIVVDVRFRPLGGTRRPPAVALTFDDGPWPRSTLQVLRILERMDAKATFFMVGYLAERYPQLVRRVARAGMEIATHSWVHPYRTPFVDLTPHRIQTEIERPADLFRKRFGITPTLFRPPGGVYDQAVVRMAREAGMRLVKWSVDPGDYRDDATPGGIASAVLRSVRPGSIVLLHDGGGDQSATVRALPRIIRGIRQMGLELVTIDA